MDATQVLKYQLGELIVNQAVLQSQLEELKKENDDLKKQLEDKQADA